MKNSTTQQGFTLIEVVIALAVLSFGILTLMLMQLSSIKGNATSSTITAESNLAAERIERILDLDYFNANLTDTDSDGTNQDWNADGIDEVGSDDTFGLNDIGVSNATGCTAAGATPEDSADHCMRSGDYDIFWNIAVNQPVPNSKKIRVIVVPNRGKATNMVIFDYIKADII